MYEQCQALPRLELLDTVPSAEAEVCREDLSAEVWRGCPWLSLAQGATDQTFTPVEERLVQATKAKEEGNTHFKAGTGRLRVRKAPRLRPVQAGTLEQAARSYLLALELLGFEADFEEVAHKSPRAKGTSDSEADADPRAEEGVWSDAVRRNLGSLLGCCLGQILRTST